MAARQLGAIHCCAKPLEASELLAILRRIKLEGGATRAADRSDPDTGPPTGGDHLRSLIAPVVDPALTLADFLKAAEALRLTLAPSSVHTQPERLLLQASHPTDARIDRALSLFENTPRWWSAAQVAAVAGTSPSHLGRVLRRHTGLDFRALRRVMTMRRAVVQVLTTNEQFAQIAFSLGFNHPSQLDHEFGRLFGCSPRALRRRWVRQRR